MGRHPGVVVSRLPVTSGGRAVKPACGQPTMPEKPSMSFFHAPSNNSNKLAKSNLPIYSGSCCWSRWHLVSLVFFFFFFFTSPKFHCLCRIRALFFFFDTGGGIGVGCRMSAVLRGVAAWIILDLYQYNRYAELICFIMMHV